ncbi:MAG: hypothetical protein P1V51_04470 [Deltaproteobacteria bacterium]|nr:hypothetical protein [Deltaproteobacteria bacterium]
MRSKLFGLAALSLLLSACAAAPPAPTVDPEGPVVRVRAYPIEVTGEEEILDVGARSILTGRICGTLTEIGGERMNCLTHEDIDRLATAVAWRETLGGTCDEGQGQGCAETITDLEFDLVVRGSLAMVDGKYTLDLSVLRITPPERVASKRIQVSKPDGLFDEVEAASREFAWIILGAK